MRWSSGRAPDGPRQDLYLLPPPLPFPDTSRPPPCRLTSDLAILVRGHASRLVAGAVRGPGPSSNADRPVLAFPPLPRRTPPDRLPRSPQPRRPLAWQPLRLLIHSQPTTWAPTNRPPRHTVSETVAQPAHPSSRYRPIAAYAAPPRRPTAMPHDRPETAGRGGQRPGHSILEHDVTIYAAALARSGWPEPLWLTTTPQESRRRPIPPGHAAASTVVVSLLRR